MSINFYFFSRLFRVASLLQGKGGGKKGRFQGKVSSLADRDAIEKLLQEYFPENS